MADKVNWTLGQIALRTIDDEIDNLLGEKVRCVYYNFVLL